MVLLPDSCCRGRNNRATGPYDVLSNQKLIIMTREEIDYLAFRKRHFMGLDHAERMAKKTVELFKKGKHSCRTKQALMNNLKTKIKEEKVGTMEYLFYEKKFKLVAEILNN